MPTDTSKIETALDNNPNAGVAATPPAAKPQRQRPTPAPPPVDDGLVSSDDDTQDTPPLKRRVPRDPVQVSAERTRQTQSAENKPDPMPLLDPDIESLPDNDGEPTAETEGDPGDEDVGGEAGADSFDEDLYVRARSVGLTREEIVDFQKTDGRLQRIVDRLEDSRAARQPRRETAPKVEPKPEKTFDEKAVMEAYGITDKNDPLLKEMRESFEERQTLAKRVAEMEERDLERGREAFALRLDGHFSCKAMIDKYGDLFGGEQTTEDLGDSREAAARDAILERAKFDARRDREHGRRPKSERQYILEAADSLYGMVANRVKVTNEKKGQDTTQQLRDRSGQFIKRPDGRKVPQAPETGDDAAKRNIREKLNLKPEDGTANRIVEESLLAD